MVILVRGRRRGVRSRRAGRRWPPRRRRPWRRYDLAHDGLRPVFVSTNTPRMRPSSTIDSTAVRLQRVRTRKSRRSCGRRPHSLGIEIVGLRPFGEIGVTVHELAAAVDGLLGKAKNDLLDAVAGVPDVDQGVGGHPAHAGPALQEHHHRAVARRRAGGEMPAVPPPQTSTSALVSTGTLAGSTRMVAPLSPDSAAVASSEDTTNDPVPKTAIAFKASRREKPVLLYAISGSLHFVG